MRAIAQGLELVKRLAGRQSNKAGEHPALASYDY